jgi:hypothetical protein
LSSCDIWCWWYITTYWSTLSSIHRWSPIDVRYIFSKTLFCFTSRMYTSVAYAIEHIFFNLCLESNFQKKKI